MKASDVRLAVCEFLFGQDEGPCADGGVSGLRIELDHPVLLLPQLEGRSTLSTDPVSVWCPIHEPHVTPGAIPDEVPSAAPSK